MNKYRTSSGEKISHATIESRLTALLKKLHSDGRPKLCQCCGDHRAEDNDHTISKARCKELGIVNLVYDPRNISFSCRKAHREWESYGDGKFFHHNNFKDRMSLVALYDRETYIKRLFAVKENHPKFAEQIDEMINATAL